MLAGCKPTIPLETRLLQGVAERWGIPAETIAGDSRKPHVCAARREWVTNVYGSIGLVAETARRVGRDHGTVIHSLRREGLRGPLGMPRKAVAR
jgi:chromosomal replication initiation ATPase DnaA